MSKFIYEGFTRVAFPPAIADIDAPTLDELRAVVDDYYLDVYTEEYIGAFEWVYDIHCELTKGGLSLPKSDETIDSTPWKGGLVQERPTRWGVAGAQLRGYRRSPPDVEVLWSGAQWKARRALVIRRGVPVTQDWAADDVVEVYRVQIGRRFNLPSASNANTQFVVPLYVYAENDEAVLVE